MAISIRRDRSSTIYCSKPHISNLLPRCESHVVRRTDMGEVACSCPWLCRQHQESSGHVQRGWSQLSYGGVYVQSVDQPAEEHPWQMTWLG